MHARFGIVLLIAALSLLGMEAMSTRRKTTKQVVDCSAEALEARQSWRHREGQFSAMIPPLHRPIHCTFPYLWPDGKTDD